MLADVQMAKGRKPVGGSPRAKDKRKRGRRHNRLEAALQSNGVWVGRRQRQRTAGRCCKGRCHSVWGDPQQCRLLQAYLAALPRDDLVEFLQQRWTSREVSEEADPEVLHGVPRGSFRLEEPAVLSARWTALCAAAEGDPSPFRIALLAGEGCARLPPPTSADSMRPVCMD